MATNKISEQAERILKRLHNGKPKKGRVNILVVGMPKVGKSTLINSLLMALNNDGWEEAAKYGETIETKRLRQHPINKFLNQDDDSNENDFKCLPVFWDIPGLSNEKDEKKILELLLSGRIKPGQVLDKEFRKDMEKKAEMASAPERVIHLVCFVHAVDMQIPTELISAVVEATDSQERDVPVFGIISKMDRLQYIEMTDVFEEWFPSLVTKIGLKGVDERVFKMSLYCEATTEKKQRKEDLDRNLCELWRTLLKPSYCNRDEGEEAPADQGSRCSVM